MRHCLYQLFQAIICEKIRFMSLAIYSRGYQNVSLATNATAGQLQLSIRGVNFLSFSPLVFSQFLIYQDEVVLNSPQASGLFNLDSHKYIIWTQHNGWCG